MSEFEKSFQKIVDTAVNEAFQKYVNQLSNQEVYMTVGQFAKKLGVTSDKIHSWINRKNNPLPAYNSGERETRIIESEFREWYRKQYRINPGQVGKLIDLKRVQ